MNTAYQNLCARLMMAGVPDARFDAAQLYQFATGRDPRLDDGPTPAEASRLAVLAERRAARHRDRLYALCKDAARFYYETLWKPENRASSISSDAACRAAL